VKAELRVTGFVARCPKKWQLESARHLAQERADQAIERLWRQRVKDNVQRRIAAKVNHGR
jgi:hypothetical protein